MLEGEDGAKSASTRETLAGSTIAPAPLGADDQIGTLRAERRAPRSNDASPNRAESRASAPSDPAARLSVLALALPVIGQNFLGMLVGWSDAILAGQILVHEDFLAAGTVAGYLLWLVESSSTLITIGCQAIVARMEGARDRRSAEFITQQSLLLALITGSLAGGAMYFGADRAAGMMGLEGSARSLCAQFLRNIAWSGPFMHLLLVGTVCLRAAGHTMAGMWILALVNLVNVAFSWMLTVGFGPLPALGWPGISAGTSISFVVGGILTWIWLKRGWSDLRLPDEPPWPDGSAARRILRIGIPGSATTFSVLAAQLWFLAIIASLGTASTAAHGVAIRCESLSFLTADAFSVAAATMVGQSLGASRARAARRRGWEAVRLGFYCLSAMGVIFYFGAEILFRLFVRPEEADVFRLGVPLLRLVAFAMPALSAAVILTGALRGAGDTRSPLLFNVLGLFAVRIPVACLLTSGPLGMGVYGAWVAMFLDLQVRAILAIWLFARGRWTKIEV